MKELILSIDYEVFLGKITGGVKECMIDPTNKLSKILKKNNSKMTVFWDILHYYKILEFQNDFKELKEDRILLENQIIDLVKEGHDVQLHLHPHWLDATYENGEWRFDYNRFSLHNLSLDGDVQDINTIEGCISITKKILENIVRKVKPEYKVTTFRAGGYLIEPFNDLSKALLNNGIYIESTVCPDFTNDNDIFSFNFTSYPKKTYYKFNTNLSLENNEGCFWEIPIRTVKIPTLWNIYFTILRKLKYPDLEGERKGIGAGYSISSTQTSQISKIIKLLTYPKVIQLSTDSNFKEKFDYSIKKVPKYSNMILHPKLLNSHTINLIKEYINFNKIKFNSISDFINILQ